MGRDESVRSYRRRTRTVVPTMASMTAANDALALEPTRPLMRREYGRLVDAGVFDDENIELIEGRLVVMSPEGAPHVAVIVALNRLLVLALEGRALVRVGHPLAVSEISQPQPDLAAVPMGDQSRQHPETAELAIEVAYSSIRKDRVVKPGLYAGAVVREYWIVDLHTDTVTILTEPVGGGYAHTEVRGRGQSISPVAFPDVSFAIDDFLPPVG